MIIDYRDIPAREEREGTRLICRYDGMEHLLSVAERALVGEAETSRASRRTGMEVTRWTGTKNFAEALQLARMGWPEGNARMAKLLPELLTWFSDRTQRDVWRYDVEGEQVDVPRMLDGEVECWHKRWVQAGRRRGRKYLHVVVNAAITCNVTADQILNRGALVGGFITAVEQAGYRVQVTVVQGVAQWAHRDTVALIVPIKTYDERLHPEQILFPIAHPSMLRRIIFGAEEMLSRETRERMGFSTHGNYGQPADLTTILVPDGHIHLNLGQEITKEGLLQAAAAAGFHFSREEA